MKTLSSTLLAFQNFRGEGGNGKKRRMARHNANAVHIALAVNSSGLKEVKESQSTDDDEDGENEGDQKSH